MPWVALRKQNIKRDGEYVDVEIGDEIPEAEFWPNRNAWVRTKRIAEVPFVGKQKKVEVAVKPPAPTVEKVVAKAQVEIAPKIETPSVEAEAPIVVKTRRRGRPKKKKVE